MVDKSQCEFPKCQIGQNSTTHNCTEEDGYEKHILHHAWSTKCPSPDQVSIHGSSAYNNYIWEHLDSYAWGTNIITQCIYGYGLPPGSIGTAGVDSETQRQTMKCEFDMITQTWQWNPPMFVCLPIYCKTPPPDVPSNAIRIINLSANEMNHQKFGTNITYFCPEDRTLDPILIGGHSFDFNLGSSNELTLTCELDSSWQVHNGSYGDR